MPDDDAFANGRVRRFTADASMEDVRRFVLGEASRSPRGAASVDSVRVTLRMLPNAVEMAVGPAETHPPATTFSDWFVKMLREEGLTQQAAARRLGVSGKTVNRWVRGHTEPRMRELRRVQAVFGASPPL